MKMDNGHTTKATNYLDIIIKRLEMVQLLQLKLGLNNTIRKQLVQLIMYLRMIDILIPSIIFYIVCITSFLLHVTL